MATQTSANMIEILLVDDDPGDVRLTVEALKQTKMYTNLSFARDGFEALAFLRRQGKFAAGTDGCLRPAAYSISVAIAWIFRCRHNCTRLRRRASPQQMISLGPR